MRLSWFAIIIAACGGSSGNPSSPDGGSAADGSNAPPPRVIPGGGIGDGPIAGVAYVYAIDDTTRTPITGATVTVGTVSGTTDATGLFTAEGISGPQDVLVVADGYRAENWLGANGTNMTLDLQTQTAATPASANLAGTIDLSGFTVASGHLKVGVVTFSQDDKATDAANNLPTANGANVCAVSADGSASQACAFTVTTRVGSVALVAAVLDHAPDNSNTLIGWAYRVGITVIGGANQSGLDLNVVAGNETTTETFQFGTPPSGLATVEGIAGIDLGDDGVLDLPLPLTPTAGAATLLVPTLATFTGATYRFSGIAEAAGSGAVPESVVLLRNQTGSSISAGTWLAPPTNVSASVTTATWTPSPGALVHSAEYIQGTTHLLNMTVFDGRTTVAIPAAADLPTTGVALTANVSALAATLDLTSFSLDEDRDKLTGESVQPAQVSQ